MLMGVDVVIVTFNSATTVGRAIASCRTCNDIASVVVVDNASGDGSVQAATVAGADEVEANGRNEGFAHAVNSGLRRGRADAVLLLNPDAEVTPGALAELVQALDENPQAAMAAPTLVEPGGELVVGARRFSTVANRLLWWLPLPRSLRAGWATPEYGARRSLLASMRPVPVDYLWGAALLVRRSFLDEIGGLDSRFFMYSEDEDLGRSARARGLPVLLVPYARVVHVGGVSTGDRAWARARMQAANRLLLEKWEGPAAARIFWTAIGPVLLLRVTILRLAGHREAAAETARQRRFLRAARAEADAVAARRGTGTSRNGCAQRSPCARSE